MKEEDILLKKLGKENSFKVPDGYFENLTSEVMNKLPEKEKVAFKEEPVSTWTRLKPLLHVSKHARLAQQFRVKVFCGIFLRWPLSTNVFLFQR